MDSVTIFNDIFVDYLRMLMKEPKLQCILKLRDSTLEAYNKKYETKLGVAQLFQRMEEQQNFNPREPNWQTMFLNEFKDNEYTYLKSSDTIEDVQQIIKKEEDSMEAHEEPKTIVRENAVLDNSNVESVVCKPDISAIEADYKTMSLDELKRALLVSKLEMLEAQQAVIKLKENIRLTEEEHLKRQIDKININ